MASKVRSFIVSHKRASILIGIATIVATYRGYSGTNVVDANNLVERGGLKYEIISVVPFTGTSICHLTNGHMKEECEFRNGKLDGLLTYWYENGLKEDECEFRNGQREGHYTHWYDNGQKHSEGEYRNGRPEGHSTMWHENGKKAMEGEYHDGKRQGHWTWWYYDGQIKSEGDYRNDEIVHR